MTDEYHLRVHKAQSTANVDPQVLPVHPRASLPLELIQMIFSFDDDIPTLTSSSTTCRAFREASEKRMYREIHFGLRINEFNDCLEVRPDQLADKKTVLLKHVDHVEVLYSNHINFALRIFLGHFIPRLPNLQHLSIRHPKANFANIIPPARWDGSVLNRLNSVYTSAEVDSSFIALLETNQNLKSLGFGAGHEVMIKHAHLLRNIQSLDWRPTCADTGEVTTAMKGFILSIAEGSLQNVRLRLSNWPDSEISFALMSAMSQLRNLRRVYAPWPVTFSRWQQRVYYSTFGSARRQIIYLGKLLFGHEYPDTGISALVSELQEFTGLETLHCEIHTRHFPVWSWNAFLEEVVKTCPALNQLVVEEIILTGECERIVRVWRLVGDAWTEGTMDITLTDSLWEGGRISVCNISRF